MKKSNFLIFTFPLLMMILTAPLAFSEVEETSITLSSQEIKKPEYATGIEKLTITGHVQSYERGDTIHLISISPSGDIIKYNTSGTEDGDFFTIFNINKEFESGEYQLILEYRNEQISSVLFKIV